MTTSGVVVGEHRVHWRWRDEKEARLMKIEYVCQAL